ncbi:MAG: hypothetical protein ACOC2A_01700 [Halanaeroarchaeum sp.]
MEEIETLTLPQRVVLLGVTALEEDGETPAHVNVVTRHCQKYTSSIADLGKLTEAETDRALNVLDAEELVNMPSTYESSPIGKGRPAYELIADRSAVLDALAEDDRLSEHADRLREEA